MQRRSSGRQRRMDRGHSGAPYLFTAAQQHRAQVNHTSEMGLSITDIPIFDRGSFADVELGGGPGGDRITSTHRTCRTAHDRVPAKETVTARLLGDPRPDRAGQAPPCEDARRAEESAEAYRLLGREPPAEHYGVKDLAKVRARLDRLAPRRWRPRQEAAE